MIKGELEHAGGQIKTVWILLIEGLKFAKLALDATTFSLLNVNCCCQPSIFRCRSQHEALGDSLGDRPKAGMANAFVGGNIPNQVAVLSKI